MYVHSIINIWIDTDTHTHPTHTHAQRHIYSDVLHEKDSFLSENFLPLSLKTTKHKPKYMASSKLHRLMDRILIFKKLGRLLNVVAI